MTKQTIQLVTAGRRAARVKASPSNRILGASLKFSLSNDRQNLMQPPWTLACCLRLDVVQIGVYTESNYDKEAPTNEGVKHTPSGPLWVRKRCTVFVTGSTHAASRVSSVVKPRER